MVSPSASSDDATRPPPSTIIRNVHVVTMLDEKVLRNQDVAVLKDRIHSIGPTGSFDIQGNARIIDGRGLYLMPGLADMHMHASPDWLTGKWPANPLKLYLANGVTTVRCFGPSQGKGVNSKYILNWRDLIDQGLLDGPAVFTCGPILYGPVKSPARMVIGQQEAGFDFIKLYSYLSPEEFKAAMDAAGDAGIFTAGHIPFMIGLDGALAGGMNEIAHVEELAWEFASIDRQRRDLVGRRWLEYAVMQLGEFFMDNSGLGLEELKLKYKDELLRLAGEVKKAGVPICSTLFLDQVIVEKVQYPQKFLKRPELNYLPASYMNAFQAGRDKHQVFFREAPELATVKRNLDLAILWALKQKDVPVILGTDAGTGGMGLAPGFSLHDELQLLVYNGYSPYEALASGTIEASRVVAAMTGRDEFGGISPGRKADLILIGGNPLTDITHAGDIRGVMAAGKWYDAECLEAFIKIQK